MATSFPERIRFVDLCAGLGGFHRALQEVDARHPQGARFECVFASELDSTLRELYLRNFPETRARYRQGSSRTGPTDDSERAPDCLIQGDLGAFVCLETDSIRRTADGVPLLPEHELLVAGFPCQPFSKSGYQKGFDDTRGTVFHMIAVVLKEHRPDLVLLENVGNFERHDGGNTWRRVREVLESLGYIVRATAHKGGAASGGRGLLSPHELGYPHHRQRFFIIAQQRDSEWPDDLNARDPFPKPVPAGGRREALAVDCLKTILRNTWRSVHPDAIVRAQVSEDRVVAIEHWNELLATLEASDLTNGKPHWRESMPSFPIWGYELDPFQWYPIDRNPSDYVGSLDELRATRRAMLDDAIEMAARKGVKLKNFPPNGSRSYLRRLNLTDADLAHWISGWPTYAGARKKWPRWKIRFIEQNRAWALRLWTELDAQFVRRWLDELVVLAPAPSNQKLEWNAKGEPLDLWDHILQFRPSGIRVKRFGHVPALVAMTSTQVPIVPRVDPDEPPTGGAPTARGRHLLQEEALQLQGFPSTWALPERRDAAFKALGNAVHCDLVADLVDSWLFGVGDTPSAPSLDL